MSTNAIAFKDLPLSDNFMFGQVMRDERVSKLFLEALLGRSIAKIEYIDKEKDLSDTLGAHGIRLDVYIQDQNQTRYNIEMQCVNQKDLERRTRYYQGGIDRNFLERGGDYVDLPESYIIFICNFDYFHAGLALYERESCIKSTDIRYDDGSHAIILNCKYQERGDVSNDILEFLDYIRTNDGQMPVVGGLTKIARKLVEEVRLDGRKERAYMTYQMQMRDERRQGRAEGRAEAYADMYRQGMLSLEVAVEHSGLTKEEFLKLAESKSN